MIRAVVAIDSLRGMATQKGIPWDLPTDRKYHKELVRDHDVIMGRRTYLEYGKKLPGRRNYIATTTALPTREGATAVPDARKFLQSYRGNGPDIWNDGGAGLFESTFDLIDELYITQIQGDFHCTKFFPTYDKLFDLYIETKPQHENGLTYTFQVWCRKNKPLK